MALDFLVIKTTIEAEINSWWPTNGNTPIFWENTPFNGTLTSAAPFYIVPRVLAATTNKIEYGTCGVKNIIGILECLVIARKDVGSGPTISKAQTFLNHFSEAVFSTVHFSAGLISNHQLIENRFQVNVTIPWNVYQD